VIEGDQLIASADRTFLFQIKSINGWQNSLKYAPAVRKKKIKKSRSAKIRETR